MCFLFPGGGVWGGVIIIFIFIIIIIIINDELAKLGESADALPWDSAGVNVQNKTLMLNFSQVL